MNIPWFLEKHTPHAGLSLAVKERLFASKSAFQRIEVLDTAEFGRMLVLDDCVMLTERDEFIYHEMLVHPALLSHGRPERVAIIGGGDGGSVREVLKHPSVKTIHLVEIDQAVVDVSREFFPALSAGLDDPRVELFVADGFEHLGEREGEYDVVLVDSIDPVGEAAKLFTRSFFEKVKHSLRAGGVVAAQTESPFFHGEVGREMFFMLQGLFGHVAPYLAHIPTYPSGLWSFHMASDTVHPLRSEPDWGLDFVGGLRYLTPELFRAAFALPKYFQDLLSKPPGTPT